MIERFTFSATTMSVPGTARVPFGVSSQAQLMTVLSFALDLPPYFGRNWDALSDCLRDLSWLPAGRVVLVHDALPRLAPSELQAYVAVLADAVASWKPGETHSLEVAFPPADRARVEAVLAQRPQQ